MDQVIEIVRLVVTGLIVVRMLDAGFRPPAGMVCSWPMSAYALAVVSEVSVTTADGRTLQRDIYRDLPAGEFLVPPDVLDDYLQYLGATYPQVSCRGWAYGADGETE